MIKDPGKSFERGICMFENAKKKKRKEKRLRLKEKFQIDVHLLVIIYVFLIQDRHDSREIPGIFVVR